MTDHVAEALKDEIHALWRQVRRYREVKERELDWFRSHFHIATKQDLMGMESRLMSAISDFKAKQDAFNDRIDAAVTGLSGDVTALKDEIIKLQNSPGTITPEDQASLDAIQARSEAIATKLEALDALTPPAPPSA